MPKTEEVEFTYRQHCVQTWTATAQVPKSVVGQGDEAVIKWLKENADQWGEDGGNLEYTDFGDHIENSVELS